MELELFKNTYTPNMMRLVKTLSQKLEWEIAEDLKSDNHHVVGKAKEKVDDLAECKMLMAAYSSCGGSLSIKQGNEFTAMDTIVKPGQCKYCGK